MDFKSCGQRAKVVEGDAGVVDARGLRKAASLFLVPLLDASDDVPDAGGGPARVVCVVVNWNNAADTLGCLRALEAQTMTDLAVVVVDNGSTDGSGEAIEGFLRGRGAGVAVRMRLLRAGANLGFAAGNNLGVHAAAGLDAEFYWLLNNDTVAPRDTLAKLLRVAEADTAAGLVGSVLLYAHEPGRVQAWGGGHVAPSMAYATHFTEPREFRRNDYLTFASVLLRAAMVRQVGLLDERFFMYYEDVEFCLRAQRAGWGLAMAGDTAILHKEGGSGGGRRSAELERAITVSGLTLIGLHGRHRRLGMLGYLLARLLNRLMHLRWREAWDVVVGAATFCAGRERGV